METYRREGFRPLTGLNFNFLYWDIFTNYSVSVPSRGYISTSLVQDPPREALVSVPSRG